MIVRRSEWKLRTRSLTLGERTLVMGVLNVTPDSFSDGGKYADSDRAFARAVELEEAGADIIDIGAESTKPGSSRISEGEELRRLIPVLKRLRGKLSVPVSVDTYKSAVADAALQYEVEIINDPSGLTWDPSMARTVIQYDAGLIINHTRGTPDSWARLGPLPDVMGTIFGELEASVSRARRAGVDRARIVVDPGLGFGKRKEQNSEILARLGDLKKLGLPYMVSASRKSFLNQTDPAALEFATAAAVTYSIVNGATIVRVHDVAAMKAVVQTADAIIAAIPEEPIVDTSDKSESRVPPRRFSGSGNRS